MWKLGETLGARVEFWVRMGEDLGIGSGGCFRMCGVVYKRRGRHEETEGNGSNRCDVAFFFSFLSRAVHRVSSSFFPLPGLLLGYYS